MASGLQWAECELVTLTCLLLSQALEDEPSPSGSGDERFHAGRAGTCSWTRAELLCRGKFVYLNFPVNQSLMLLFNKDVNWT